MTWVFGARFCICNTLFGPSFRAQYMLAKIFVWLKGDIQAASPYASDRLCVLLHLILIVSAYDSFWKIAENPKGVEPQMRIPWSWHLTCLLLSSIIQQFQFGKSLLTGSESKAASPVSSDLGPKQSPLICICRRLLRPQICCAGLLMGPILDQYCCAGESPSKSRQVQVAAFRWWFFGGFSMHGRSAINTFQNNQWCFPLLVRRLYFANNYPYWIWKPVACWNPGFSMALSKCWRSDEVQLASTSEGAGEPLIGMKCTPGEHAMNE